MLASQWGGTFEEDKDKAKNTTNHWPCAAESSLVKPCSFSSQMHCFTESFKNQIDLILFFFPFMSKVSRDMSEKVLGKSNIYTVKHNGVQDWGIWLGTGDQVFQ